MCCGRKKVAEESHVNRAVKKKDIHDNKTVEQYMITDSVLEKYKT
jgi:hypothetical protein